MAKGIKGVQNNVAKGVPQMHYINQMDAKKAGIGATSKVRKEKVVIKDEVTGKIFGSRVVAQKPTSESLISELLQLKEADEQDVEALAALKDLQGEPLPELIINDIKKNIRSGAKDLGQQWKNALELTQRAYQVAEVRLPDPYEDGQWKQYEQMLAFAVRQLTATRGLGGDWRLSALELKESATQALLESGRLIVQQPGKEDYELTGTNVDEATTTVINTLRRHGVSARVVTKDSLHAILTLSREGKQLPGYLTIRNVS